MSRKQASCRLVDRVTIIERNDSRRFINTSGQITITPDHITCRLKSRTYSPVMRSAQLPNTEIPWWNDRALRLQFA